jgi:hypothetical protein
MKREVSCNEVSVETERENLAGHNHKEDNSRNISL